MGVHPIGGVLPHLTRRTPYEKLIQEIIKNIHHFSSLDVLNEIEHLAKEFYFIESIQPPLFWGGNDFEEDVSKALVFTKSEYNCELTRLNSFIEVRALPLEVLISKIRTSRVFEYTNNGRSQIVSKNYFTPLTVFLLTKSLRLVK